MAARTFEQPLMQALLPATVPRVILNRAIAAHISARHLSVLIGPSLGGVLYIFGPVFDYGVCTALVLAAVVATLLMADPGSPKDLPELSLDTLLAGFRFIWRCETIWAPCCSSSPPRCSAARTRCCRFMPATSSRPAPGASASCAARLRSAP